MPLSEEHCAALNSFHTNTSKGLSVILLWPAKLLPETFYFHLQVSLQPQKSSGWVSFYGFKGQRMSLNH